MTTDWNELVQRYMSGRCTAEEFGELQDALKRDDAVARLYLRYMNLDVALEARASSSEAACMLLSSPSAGVVERRTSRRLWISIGLVVAAAAACLGLGIWHWPTGVAAEVVSVAGAPESAWKLGDHVRLKHLSWVRGSLELRLRSGVLLKITAPAELHLLNSMQIQVVSGKITADVGEHGKGFVIETPQARVVDLGTRFGVDASDAAHTDVVVFSGQVELYQAGAKERVALLQQGEALRVESHRRTSRIVSVSGSEEAGGWSTNGRPTVDSVVASVRDSMSTDDEGAKKWPTMRSYYRIVPGGMRDGSLAFSDQADCWQDVPPELEGADQVRTFAVDSLNWWMALTIELSRPGELFVFVDQRNPVPRWVREQFTDTGKTLTLNFKPSQLEGRVHQQLPYAIWRREVERGSVTLGPPYENPPADRKSFSPNRMFGIAVKARENP